MAVSAAASDNSAETRSVGFALAAIMLAVGMVGLALAYGVSWLAHTGNAGSTSTALVTQTLLGRQFNIPRSWLRGDTAATGGFASRVDLALTLPLGTARALAPVAVTLLPLSQVRTSASLLDGVYLHQFLPQELSGPPGLVGKPLSPAEGYAGETVWYDPLGQSPFVAKCSDPPDGRGPAQCLRSVALPNGIAAVFSFDATVLGSWKAFDPELEAALRQIGAL